MSSGDDSKFQSISFQNLIKNYNTLQSKIVAQVNKLASSISSATPGKFLLLQFGMSQVTQVGESISNLISQVNSMITASIRNQKS